MLNHHVGDSGIQEMLRRRKRRMSMDVIPRVKHKKTQTEITGSFLSNTREHCVYMPTWEISETFPSPDPSPGDVDHIRRAPKSSHSKYPPSCSFSVTSFVDESAAGSSTANPESEEIVTHSIMKLEAMPYDYKPSGTSGSSGLSSRSCLLPCSHSMVSLSKIPREKNNFTQVNSSPDTLLNEFTPVISDDFDDENYTFQCSCPGLYQCSVTGLVFLMKAEGDVVYRTVPWNRKLLAQHRKKPAGPLFDIKCQQQSVCQLCLPHCEVISTGGGQFLQVAHVNDEGIEFITPQRITESHVVINITGFSGYGNVKDEDSPPDPVQALVLLFYKPPVDLDLRSFLNVLLLPRNVVIRDVQRTRRKLIGDERYIDTPPHCKLHPKQVYTLSAVPEDDLIKVQPTEADFDDEYHDSYFTSFQVILRIVFRDISLSLKEKSSSTCVWERDLCIFSPTVGTINLPPSERLLNTRSCFIEGISEPNLNSLIDKLLGKKVITEAEREAADTKQNRGKKARFVIDTVRSKGAAASSKLINILRELDRILFEHLGLN
ncbi:NACHT, LRR and PYD domains-containing protein 1b allele 3-like [Neolamprologus brichardi]|uniref:NACHT, LRR and PYD domains-containing protein 1b allele 3-like n=1 Tax=Neolamprologus brichardi TaxID=32507 RepID=UPI0003EBBCF0|nr:NACHT, LRR and PYD domains-containing protein 1b allele 3-like [Neolamprologus brichardi]